MAWGGPIGAFLICRTHHVCHAPSFSYLMIPPSQCTNQERHSLACACAGDLASSDRNREGASEEQPQSQPHCPGGERAVTLRVIGAHGVCPLLFWDLWHHGAATMASLEAPAVGLAFAPGSTLWRLAPCAPRESENHLIPLKSPLIKSSDPPKPRTCYLPGDTRILYHSPVYGLSHP